MTGPPGPPFAKLCFWFLGELENAQSVLQRCLELDPTSVDAHLLMSQIHLAQGNFAMCSHSLELGVSHNFQVGVLCAVLPTQHPKAKLQPPLSSRARHPRGHLHPSDPLLPAEGSQALAPVVFSEGCCEQQQW